MSKEQKTDSIIQAAEHIYQNRLGLLSNPCEDKSSFESIVTISTFFEVSKPMAAVLGVMIYDQFLGDGQTLRRIMRDLGVKPVAAVDIFKELKAMRIKGWLVDGRPKLSSKSRDYYEIPKKILEAIVHNNKEGLKAKQHTCQEDALVETSSIFNLLCNETEKEELVEMLMYQLKNYIHFPIFNKVLRDEQLAEYEQLVIIWMSAQYYTNRVEVFDLTWIVDRIFKHPEWLQKIQKSMYHKKYLIESEYLTFDQPGIVDMGAVCLGNRIIDMLDVTQISGKAEPVYNLCEAIYPLTINEVNLYFNKENTRHIEEIKYITSENSYNKIVDAYKQEGMPTGVAILLSGAPGTGKTETVKQIAKEQNRVILMVDISRFKSMWLGETEKNIKRIFKEYKSACNYYDIKPILLFNEADAILSCRGKVNSSIDQTMNNIQNILLQQFEDFEGILIATTNLAENLDPAFDRRFVIKCKIDQPDKETRLSILKQQLPGLTNEVIERIALHYTLTGGQIQNIKRRIIAKRIISGESDTVESWIDNLVQDEIKTKSQTAVGFTPN